MSAVAAGNRKALAVLFAVVIIDLIGFGVVIPILPYYAEAYGADATTLGLLLTSFAAVQFLCAPLWGRLSDRVGRRHVLLMTISGTSLSLFFLGWADSLLLLFVARILGGLFGANIGVASAFVSDLTPPEERTRFMGLIGASFGIGFILGPAIGGSLAPYGLAVPMYFASGLAAVNVLFAAALLREPRTHSKSKPEEGLSVLSLGRLPSPIGRLCLSFFLFSFGVTQLESVFAFYMLGRFGWDARRVAYLLVVMAVSMAIVQGGIRSVVRRFGERRLVLVGTVILVVTLGVVPWVPTPLWLLVPLVGASIGRGIAHPSMMGLVSSAAPSGDRGAVLGTFQSMGSLARVFGPAAAGLLYDRWVPAPFCVASIAMVLVGLVAFRLPARSESLLTELAEDALHLS